MTMNELSDTYTFYYIYEDYDSGEYVTSERYMFADYDEIELFDCSVDEETAYAMEEAAYAVFCEGMAQILSDCGLTMSDMYLTFE